MQYYCVVPEGKNAGNQIVLDKWEEEAIRKIYNNKQGTRTAIISVAKKNGKTTFAAFLLLLHMAGPEHIPYTELCSTAQSRDQAAKVFRLASNIVRMSPVLDENIIIRETNKQLLCQEVGTVYSALSADATTAHGSSNVFAIHDELGQVEGPVSELYNAVENAMSAHDNPMSVVISTQAPTDADLLSMLIDDAKAGHDPHTVLIFYESDIEADPFSEKTIKQANPAYGKYQNKKEILGQAELSRRLPSQEALYRNYNLNQRVEASNPFVTRSIWTANGNNYKAWGMAYGGLDLSETNDLTALVLDSPVRGFHHIKSTFWLPEEGLEERSRKDRVPYDVWAKRGFLQTTPGRSVEYEYIANYLAKLFQEMEIRKIAFDRFNMRHLRPWLIKAGLSESFVEDHFVDFGQGYVSMSPALRSLESLLLNQKIRHNNHPVLTMCAANAVVKMDEAGNRKLDKKRSRGRIDGMIALAMASSIASEDKYERLVYPVPSESIIEDIRV